MFHGRCADQKDASLKVRLAVLAQAKHTVTQF